MVCKADVGEGVDGGVLNGGTGLGKGELLLLVLSVCDDVADVLVVHIASHIRGEGSPQVGHLQRKGWTNGL